MPPEHQRRRVALEGLQAQLALTPYMIGAFAVGLVILLPPALAAADHGWLAACLVIFAVNWAAFYAAHDWLKRAEATVEQRTRAHVLAGLLWSASLLPLTLLAESAGPLRETILLICVAAAAVIAFFTAPHLPSLLIVGPAAAASPLVALHLGDPTGDRAGVALSGVALTFALCLVQNRILRRQFVMTAEREALMAERADALAQAERLARSKSDLVATLSGEIQTGLAGVERVLAAATSSGRRSRGAPTADQLAAAYEAARELVTVVDTTLTSEEAEAGRLKLSPEPFDPFRLAHDVVAGGRAAASAKALDLALELEPGIWGLTHGDPPRVRQVLEALVGNAIRYTVRGRVEVRLMRAGDALRLEVADTGPGLSPEEAQAAFEPFTRIARTSAGVNGAGLGLSLARRLVTLMGSELRLESAPGVGSRFWFDLPFTPAEEPAVVEPPAPGPTPSLKILMAESDALDAALLRSALEQLGHKVLHAHDGARVPGLLRRAEVDALMVAAAMTGLSGREIVEAVRSEPALASTPVIAVTTADAADAPALKAAGVDAMLRKPISAASVARALAEAGAGRTQPTRAAA